MLSLALLQNDRLPAASGCKRNLRAQKNHDVAIDATVAEEDGFSPEMAIEALVDLTAGCLLSERRGDDLRLGRSGQQANQWQND